MGWMPFIKIAFGFALLLVLGAITIVIGVGNVKAETSFGLGVALGTLGSVATGWSTWAFGSVKKDDYATKETN